jgi:hypothetical protein
MLQRAAAVGYGSQHKEAGGARIFGRVVMSEDDTERPG